MSVKKPRKKCVERGLSPCVGLPFAICCYSNQMVDDRVATSCLKPEMYTIAGWETHGKIPSHRQDDNSKRCECGTVL